MDEQINVTFSDLLSDYPYIVEKLKKMGIQNPTDLQDQILNIKQQINNLIITAPEGCGKKLTLILLALKRFANDEDGTLVFVAHSMFISQEIASIVSVLAKTQVINLFMEKQLHSNVKKCIVIASPNQLTKLKKQKKDTFLYLVVPEADLLLDYGYYDALTQLASQIPDNVVYQMCAIKMGTELQAFKNKFMKKVTKIDYKPPQDKSTPIVEKTDGQAVHIYEVGEKIMTPITLYVTLKFGLVNPKTLIIVKDLREVYRYYLFLERTKIAGIGLYNHENPINLKFYCLQIWMSGPTNILIATPAIYTDISNETFKQNCKNNYKRQNFALSNLATVILVNVSYVENRFEEIMNSFPYKPFLVTILQNSEEQINSLQKLIKLQNQKFESPKIKEYPIDKKQLQAFKYRINDVFLSLGRNKVEMFQNYDFKKKMFKSPDMKQYFQENPKEKKVLLRQLSDLKNKINHDAVLISEVVPSYLVPQSLKSSYDLKIKEVQKQMKTEEVPSYVKKARDALRHVDLEEEDPQITDVSRLKLISSRKRWKLQHGFKLKKKNKKLEKKGIFES